MLKLWHVKHPLQLCPKILVLWDMARPEMAQDPPFVGRGSR